jgi:hypothetical protein
MWRAAAMAVGPRRQGMGAGLRPAMASKPASTSPNDAAFVHRTSALSQCPLTCIPSTGRATSALLSRLIADAGNLVDGGWPGARGSNTRTGERPGRRGDDRDEPAGVSKPSG